MKWFKRKQPEVPTTPENRLEALPAEHKTSIEIVAHKNASQAVVEQAKKAQKHLDELLEENGFTLKIYLAAGGKPRKKQEMKRLGN